MLGILAENQTLAWRGVFEIREEFSHEVPAGPNWQHPWIELRNPAELRNIYKERAA